MNQFSLFNQSNSADIYGLDYIENYITPQEEVQLLAVIDKEPWLLDLKRRVQHYGYKYDYKTGSIGQESYLGEMPEWLKALCTKLLNDGIFKVLPNQVIVNEYLPGQGIAVHTDCITCFGKVICSLSLGSACIIDFTNTHKVSKLLEPRSLVVMASDARYLWKHSIAPRKSDNFNGIKLLRARRVSLTFREVILLGKTYEENY